MTLRTDITGNNQLRDPDNRYAKLQRSIAGDCNVSGKMDLSTASIIGAETTGVSVLSGRSLREQTRDTSDVRILL
jgi:hypothetical protein